MNIGQNGHVRKLESKPLFIQTESEENISIIENKEIAIKLEHLGDGVFESSYRNKLYHDAEWNRLVKTDEFAVALKVLFVFKQGVRIGSKTETTI